MRNGELYRNKKQGRVAGVCVGLADYFGIEAWLVRILTVTAFLLLAPPFVIVGYIALWFILDDKSQSAAKNGASMHSGVETASNTYAGKGHVNTDLSHEDRVAVKSKVWQAGVPPRQALMDLKQRFGVVESRLQSIETVVTSKEFQLNREISRL